MELDDLRAACNRVKRDYLSQCREITVLGNSCNDTNLADTIFCSINNNIGIIMNY